MLGQINSGCSRCISLPPPLSDGLLGLSPHPSPRKLDTRAGRQANAPSPMMIDRVGEFRDNQLQDVRTRRTFETFESYPAPCPLDPGGDLEVHPG